MKNVAFLGNYAPRCCGIATFTQDLRTAVVGNDAGLLAPVVMVSDKPGEYSYPEEVKLVLPEQDRAAYSAAAEKINASGVEAVSLQHEFGIFGGPSGAWILEFLKHLRVPVITTCHTVLREPSAEQLRIMRGIARYSACLVVMAEKGREFLREIYGVPDEKIAVIPHGIPDADVSPAEREAIRERQGWNNRHVLFTFGLVAPSKGLEHVIRALPAIVKDHPDALYVVTGATHPNLLRDQGEKYREGLMALAEELGVADHLQFINRFVSRDDLIQLIAAADVYVTPYLSEAQITSGTLAYAFGMGKPVISTPYWHAAELLADDHGVLVPFRDSPAIAAAAISLIADAPGRQAMSERAWQKGRGMTWEAVARAYTDVMEAAVLATHRKSPLTPVADLVPAPVLDQFERMMGPHGLFQHGKGTEPDFDHGYCTDDNARAVIALTDLMRCGHRDPRIEAMFPRCFDFLLRACDLRTDLFRNFMHTEGHWLEPYGSEDSHGRALWALGHVYNHHPSSRVRESARQIFHAAAPATVRFTSPRAWAFTILGLTNYIDGAGGDDILSELLRDELSSRLFGLYQQHSSSDWIWFEDCVTYDNAKLPEALMAAGRQSGNSAWAHAGLRMLGFLVRSQTAPGGWFRPIGSEGFWKRGEDPAQWDQQPLEAQAMIGGSLEAFRLTGHQRWLHEATRAFGWFTGDNDLGIPVADVHSGGCCDGVQVRGLNRNQGAESILAWLQSLAQMRLTGKTAITAAPPPDVLVPPAPNTAAA